MKSYTEFAYPNLEYSKYFNYSALGGFLFDGQLVFPQILSKPTVDSFWGDETFSMEFIDGLSFRDYFSGVQEITPVLIALKTVTLQCIKLWEERQMVVLDRNFTNLFILPDGTIKQIDPECVYYGSTGKFVSLRPERLEQSFIRRSNNGEYTLTPNVYDLFLSLHIFINFSNNPILDNPGLKRLFLELEAYIATANNTIPPVTDNNSDVQIPLGYSLYQLVEAFDKFIPQFAIIDQQAPASTTN